MVYLDSGQSKFVIVVVRGTEHLQESDPTLGAHLAKFALADVHLSLVGLPATRDPLAGHPLVAALGNALLRVASLTRATMGTA